MKRSLALTILAGLQTGCVATMLDAHTLLHFCASVTIRWSAAASKYDLGGHCCSLTLVFMTPTHEMPLKTIQWG